MIAGVEKVSATSYLYGKCTCPLTCDEPNGLLRLSKMFLSLRHEHPSSLLGLPKKILVNRFQPVAHPPVHLLGQTISSWVVSSFPRLIQGVVIDGVRTHTGSCYRWSEDSHKELLLGVWTHTGSCYRCIGDAYRELL